jgi:hypothetical protein
VVPAARRNAMKLHGTTSIGCYAIHGVHTSPPGITDSSLTRFSLWEKGQQIFLAIVIFKLNFFRYALRNPILSAERFFYF